jgi:hypothetical protein
VRVPPIFQKVPICPTVEPDGINLIVDVVALKVMVIVPAVADGVIVITLVLSSRKGPPRKAKFSSVQLFDARRVSFCGGWFLWDK